MPDRYKCVLLFGAPGVGKGTQGKLLGQQDGFVHLATGDIFRSLDRESEDGKEFLRYSTKGELVPDALTVHLWRGHVHKLTEDGLYDPSSEVLLLDGIPRSLIQAEMLDDHIDPIIVTHLVASDLDEMVNRMKRRAEKEGRLDDADEEVIRRRFEVYETETAPVLDHYDPWLICEVDAMGTIEEVAERIRFLVDEQLP